ncbi:monovalent cation:H+ antiporter, CPA1 family [Algoriella xinjiangensis]|uniref:Monovalent cation:H+ antiporter, CPA1 family n=1 Tax=Algoriella xinjiangensis TaxID=684065 RepID=A0A1I4S534_9FLAO|nr:Na+/H+ antiporter [Algoriella xinjiangensis]SFM59585.1 monovalent cation:H+ antiporter, CPA1 family [Algoriella xinjiangensis]VDH15904.1 Sodium, potassium, lithium and rubidium/H(+) antiporter [Algoriella xinjiangensis]
MIEHLPFFFTIIVLIVLLNLWANKLKIAYPILLVIAGLGISFIPELPILHIDPDLIFFIFLPPLLFEASWSVSLKEMKKWWRIIGSFAFLVVFFTAFLVAIVSNHIIPGFSIALGFVLGGIVSPPDAVSTGAITKFVKIPKSTSAILEGESLLNDASSLIIFRFALITVGTGQFIWQEAIVDFVWMLIGGVGIGLIIAWIFMQAHKRLATDAPSDIILTLIAPYIMYYVAEEMHCSGVLAVVCGGLFMSSNQLKFLASSSRLKGFNFWESFVFLLNGLVFFIIGLGLPEIVAGIKSNGIPIETAIGYGVIVTIVLILARMISSYTAMFSTMIFRPQVAHSMNFSRRTFLTPLALGWTGMRGVVSLAAALSIPLKLNGEPFPYRNLILFVTFVVILLTLVIQGLTLPYIINKYKPFLGLEQQEKDEAEMHMQIKKGLKQHVYIHIKEKYERDWIGHAGMERVLKHWEEQANSQDVRWIDDNIKVVLLEMFEIQRDYLNELNKDPEINEELIRQQIHQIDLEEERIRFV